ncbi:MAG: hypothetical protein LT070_07030 [Solirubrobacteraceae bacterium]|nr:hypothetical protein [Solirubrobacteraceae bacterium]
MIELRREVSPAWPVRLPRAGLDGVARRRGQVWERLVHVDGAPAVVRATQRGGASGPVLLAARASSAAVAEEAIARVRFALALDDDLRPFYEAFRDDPLIGESVRARPELRVPRRPEPFEALAWAICEQLIEYRRAAAIERRLVLEHGARCERTGLRDVPSAESLAALAPARLESAGLSPSRALALRRAAIEVSAGRVDLRAADQERGWARLARIPGIGRWTIDVLALHGQGRYDRLPAGDLAYLKLVGRLLRGRPSARADEPEVRELFAPYGRWAGLAGAHALGAPVGLGSLRAAGSISLRSAPRLTSPRPRPEGTRSSPPARRRRAA